MCVAKANVLVKCVWLRLNVLVNVLANEMCVAKANVGEMCVAKANVLVKCVWLRLMFW